MFRQATLLLASVIFSGVANAQPFNETWTFNLNGKVVPANPDGSIAMKDVGFLTIDGVYSDRYYRVMGSGLIDGRPHWAASDLILLPVDGLINLRSYQFTVSDQPIALPNRLIVTGDGVLIPGQLGQLLVQGEYGDGSTRDVTMGDTFTTYSVVPSSGVLEVDENGGLTAVAPGVAIVQVINTGALASKIVRVVPDRLDTTLEGFVFFPDGASALGADITVSCGQTARTDGAGFFSVPVSCADGEPVMATATITTPEGPWEAQSGPIELIADGLSDAGLLTLVPIQPEAALFGHYLLPIDGQPSQLLFADVIPGGAPYDLVAVSSGQGRLNLLLLGPDGPIRRDLDVPGGAEQAVAGDFNGDGWTDFLVRSGLAVTLALNLGDASFLLEQVPELLGSTNLAVGEIDGDAHLDVVAGTFAQVRVYRGLGTGQFSLLGTYAPGGIPGDQSVAVTDLNGDSVLDIIAVDRERAYTRGLSTFFGQGDGTFALQQFLPDVGVRGDAGELQIGHINGDPAVDLLFNSREGSGGTGGTSFILNDGTGQLRLDGVLPSAYPTSLGDLDGDGALDFMTNDPSAAPLKKSFFFNDGQGAFTTGGRFLLWEPVTLPVSAIGDVDLDGQSEMIWAESFSPKLGAVAVFPPGDDGTFSVPRITAYSLRESRHLIQDLNGDEALDITILTRAPNGTGLVRVGLNAGDGSFTVVDYPSTIALDQMTAGDLDADGDLDLIVVGRSAIQSLRNEGDGTFFVLPPASSEFVVAHDVVTQDLSSDGLTDLCVMDYGSDPDRLVVLLGNGDGTFSLEETHPLVGARFRGSVYEDDLIVLADLDADGDRDLAVPIFREDEDSGGEVAVFINLGSGSLSLSSSHPVYPGTLARISHQKEETTALLTRM